MGESPTKVALSAIPLSTPKLASYCFWSSWSESRNMGWKTVVFWVLPKFAHSATGLRKFSPFKILRPVIFSRPKISRQSSQPAPGRLATPADDIFRNRGVSPIIKHDLLYDNYVCIDSMNSMCNNGQLLYIHLSTEVKLLISILMSLVQFCPSTWDVGPLDSEGLSCDWNTIFHGFSSQRNSLSLPF